MAKSLREAAITAQENEPIEEESATPPTEERSAVQGRESADGAGRIEEPEPERRSDRSRRSDDRRQRESSASTASEPPLDEPPRTEPAEEAQRLEGEARSERLAESLRLRDKARSMLRTSLLSGALDDYGEGPHRDLLDLSQNAVALLLLLDRCDEAEDTLDYALGDALIMPEGAIEELRQLRDSIDRCQERVVAREIPTPAESPGTPTPVEPVPVETARRDIVPWVLIGAGGAMLVSALAFDLALIDTRDEFQTIQDACRDGCWADQYSMGLSLRDQIDSAKVTTRALAAAAA